MKQTTLTLFMAAFVIMLTTPFAVSPDCKTKKVTVQISYYWFDPTTTYTGHQATLATEILNTGWNESTQNPKTLQEKGWAPGNVTFDGSGTPVPISGTPDKILYSHP